MTKEKFINRLTKMIIEGITDSSYSKIKQAFRECIAWNDEHPNNEICMVENDEYILIEDEPIYMNNEH